MAGALTAQLSVMLETAGRIAQEMQAEAVLLLAERELPWKEVAAQLKGRRLLVATDNIEMIKAAHADEVETVQLPEDHSATTVERIGQALLEAVADDQITSGARIVALYSGFQPDAIDSISVLHLAEHLERLTGRELRQLETHVPLDVLRTVVNLAVELGREGREGRPVGTIFVVGDTRKVLQQSQPMVFDPVRGYKRSERNIRDRAVREQVKEIAQMDGAVIIDADGTVVSAGRHLESPVRGTAAKGLGARHRAAAAITRSTRALAIVVSESTGTVRLYQNGQVWLRIEPLRRAMKFMDFGAPEVQEDGVPLRGDTTTRTRGDAASP